jgi:hypothetical protein
MAKVKDMTLADLKVFKEKYCSRCTIHCFCPFHSTIDDCWNVLGKVYDFILSEKSLMDKDVYFSVSGKEVKVGYGKRKK